MLQGNPEFWRILIPATTDDLSEPLPDLPDGAVLDLDRLGNRLALEIATALRSPRAIALFDATGDYGHPWPDYLEGTPGWEAYEQVMAIVLGKGWLYGHAYGCRIYLTRPRTAH